MALGTPGNPLQVAIVGSGPSGFYAAEELLQCGLAVEVCVLEKLPVPFGLVRSGVAPDHPKLKQPIAIYDRIAHSPQFSFFGNVSVGEHLSVRRLRELFHAVVFAYGASGARTLGLPGENLPGSHTAADFVGWYNGHPQHACHSFDLSCDTAVIIGQGNVAIDVARILLKSPDELRHTDIARHALDALAASRIRNVYIVGRRGPVQAKFASQEIHELGLLPDCEIGVEPGDLALNAASEAELNDKAKRNVARNFELFRKFRSQEKGHRTRRCHFLFYLTPKRIFGKSFVTAIELCRTQLDGAAFSQVAVETAESRCLPCGLVLSSIGYRGAACAGVPFDHDRGVIPNVSGRVVRKSGEPECGLYATGWIKRGPTGVIGTNRADSVETIGALLADFHRLDSRAKDGARGLRRELDCLRKPYVTYEQWKAIDAAEIERGTRIRKPREKFVDVAEMLNVAHAHHQVKMIE